MQPLQLAMARIAVELNLSEKLEAGSGKPKGSEELAKACGTDSLLMGRFLLRLLSLESLV